MKVNLKKLNKYKSLTKNELYDEGFQKGKLKERERIRELIGKLLIEYGDGNIRDVDEFAILLSKQLSKEIEVKGR